MPLEEYRRKRDFSHTAEPKGGRTSSESPGHSFVVQKHAASRLHYDFRLELGGVLLSWAVPRGPSLDPAEKRLAVQVEDHPLEYALFEGTIPQGEYGGGTVIVWDRGTWQADGDPAESLRQGKLKFRLEGEKLRGGWVLVRTRGRGGEKNWLLFKERDDEARKLAEYDVLAERPESVLSGRTVDELTADPRRTWKSGGAAAAKGNGRKAAAKKATKKAVTAKAKGATKKTRAAGAPLPDDLAPQLARLADAAPDGEEWLHEIKHDGYRILCALEGGQVTLRTRGGLDWTARYPELAKAAAALPARRAVLDGELVALLPGGESSFQELQNAMNERKTGQLVYYAFDLLFLDGEDLRPLPLEQRKARLAPLVAAAGQGRLRYSDHVEGRGPEFLAQSCRLGLEGIVSKRRDRPHRAGRGDDCLKVKCVRREEFVVGGFTPPAGSRTGLGALLLGQHDQSGRLVYAGKVGTGFSASTLSALTERLKAREQRQSPFADLGPSQADAGTRWVRPELVAQIEYGSRTRDGLLRHSVFQGLREDKPAAEVVPEADAGGGKAAVARPPARARARAGESPATAAVGLSPERLRELEGVKLSHPDRVLYPDQGITKLGLAVYYAQVADWILPHVVNRPLSLVRCPAGQGGQCFYQKHAAAGTPEHLRQVVVREKDKEEPYLVADGLAGLLSLVQMGVLEVHPWGATADDVGRPDRLILDLDPDPSVGWPRVVEGARELRERLSAAGLESFVKTTGGKGLHVVAPLQRRHTWEEVKAFARALCEAVVADSRQKYTANLSKAARKGKIFLDYLRNDRGATAVAPYSTRSKAGAPVSTPLAWDELSAALRSDHFHVGNLPARLTALKADPWEGFFSVRQSLTAKARKSLGL